MEKKKISLKQFINQLTRTMDNLTIRTFHFNPLAVNTMVLFDDSKEAVIVDPGNWSREEDEQLKEYIVKNGLKVKYILNTHPHVDHISGNWWCVEQFGAPIVAYDNADGLEVYRHASLYASVMGQVLTNTPPEPTIFVKDGDEICFGHQKLQVLETPGHCIGSMCFYHREEKFIITGDLIFEYGVGRTDLPTGNTQQLMQSIQNKIFCLEDDIVLYPGHGNSTSIGNERKYNPYL